jgi:hypothetical protein
MSHPQGYKSPESCKKNWELKKLFFLPMRQIDNPLFSNPAKENMLRVSIRQMLMGLQVVQRQVDVFPLFDNSIAIIWHGTGSRGNWNWALNSRQTPAKNVL